MGATSIHGLDALLHQLLVNTQIKKLARDGCGIDDCRDILYRKVNKFILKTGRDDMQLCNITPYNGIDGFGIDSLRKDSSLLGESLHSSLLIDYHLEVRIWSTGTNYRYPASKKIRILISQFIDSCDLRFGGQDPEAIIVVLEVYQTLEMVRLVEACVGDAGGYKPYLLLAVKDTRNGGVYTQVWDIFKPESVTKK